MIRNSKLFHYIGIALLLWYCLQHCARQKVIEAQKIKEQTKETKEDESVNVDIFNLKQTIEDVEKKIINKKTQSKNQSLLMQSLVSYDQSQNQNLVSLCSNSYKMKATLFNEDSEIIYQNDEFSIMDLNPNTELFNTLIKAVILIDENDFINVIVPELNILPDFMKQKSSNHNEFGSLKLKNIKIIGSNLFVNQGIKLHQSIYNDELTKRKLSQFFCGDDIKIKYQIYDAEDKLVKSGVKSMKLGQTQTNQDKLFEYLALTSEKGEIEASLPSYRFDPRMKDQTIKIKGIIASDK